MRFVFSLLFLLTFWCASDIGIADDNANNNNGQQKTPPQTETVEQKLAAAMRRQEELEAEIAKLKNKKDDSTSGDDDDLNKKVEKNRKAAEDHAKETKRIESALTFNLGVDDFTKKNADLLPKDISELVKQAHKETYDSAIAKASALQAAIIQSYFSIQDNLNALTKSQREMLDDYLKKTKTGKEEQASNIYENIFEPALETMRKVKKAEELGRSRSGLAASSDSDKAYNDKLVRLSREAHLGERARNA